MRRAFLAPLVVAATLAGGSGAAGAPDTCGPPPPEHVLSSFTATGSFADGMDDAYVLVPFDVPAGATKVRVRLCYDQLPTPLASTPQVQVKHTLDLGLYQPTADGFWDRQEFRGWGGSSRLDAFVSPDEATVGFLPGPLPAGEWAAEIGVAAIVGLAEGDPDASVAWRLEAFVTDDPADADAPWTPAPYDTTPANPDAGWYKGDFHVHARHSNPADAEMRTVFDYAFGARPSGAGLDFITLSDYVGTRQWDEVGRFQADYPGKLVVRSAEVITYRGHVNNHGTHTWVDYRTGPVHVLRDGDLELVREHRPASAIFDAIHAAGDGWTQVNHPTTFPSKVPPFALMCRGCSWEYTDDETDWSKVDAMEVQTGPAGYTDPKGNEPGPNPFTPPAIEWWDRLRRQGHRITAVGSSDSHKADQESLTTSPIGEATTVVYAPELSEAGIREGVVAGHAYVKFFSSDGPDLRFDAWAGDVHLGMMGDEVYGPADLKAKVLGGLPTQASPQPRELVVLYEGIPILVAPVTADPFELSLPAILPGNYRLQLQRGSAIEALTNPIAVTD